MKKIFPSFNKSTLLALVFFGVMTLVGISAAHAQSETSIDNPLFSTTGPNVLGAGSIQWNSSLDYYFSRTSYFPDSYMSVNAFGGNTGLRFGVGNSAELTLDFKGAYNVVQTHNLAGPCVNTKSFNPSVGVKLLLAEGKGWLPQVAFFTHVGMAMNQSIYNPTIRTDMVQPEIGFMFRNRLDSRWVLDYSLGYSWNAESGFDNDFEAVFRNQIQYSIFARKLVTDRFSTGIGVSNTNGVRSLAGGIEMRYLATPDLQLSLIAGAAGGIGKEANALQLYTLLGAHWTLR